MAGKSEGLEGQAGMSGKSEGSKKEAGMSGKSEGSRKGTGMSRKSEGSRKGTGMSGKSEGSRKEAGMAGNPGEETGKAGNHGMGKAGKRRQRMDEAGIGFMLFLMASCGVLECVLAGVLAGQETDRILTLAFLGVLYYVSLLTGMELCRRQSGWFYEKAGNYRQIALWHGISCGAAVGMAFLPEFARPVMLVAMGMAMASNSFFGLMFGIFHGMVYALCGQGDLYLFLCGVLLAAGGCLAAYFLDSRENLPWKAVFLFLYVFADVLICSYLAFGVLEWDVLAFGAGNGLVSAMAATLLYPGLSGRLRAAPRERLEKILQENFGLVQDVRNFSKTDYEHAKKVSMLAGACAKLVGADPDVASAGGFYYRLGRMVGEPFVENGVALARSSHLPRPVVGILSEYYGEEKLPSTVESAIVHIVDSLVAKFEVLEADTFSSTWNQDILVYQTLNEHSAAGMYDKSGFSMNMFLEIRDYLIKEAELF